MGRYVIRRLLFSLLVILIITLLTFVIFYVMPPTDPARAFAGKQPTPEILAEVRDQFGLDEPLFRQYGRFVHNIFLGDEFGWPGLGFSFDSRSPVKDELFRRAAVTLQLSIGAAFLWVVLGVSIGIISALNRGKLGDRAAMGFALFGVSTPVFFLGYIGLFIFWQTLDVLPGTGYTPFGEDPGQWFLHMIMPWAALALLYSAFYARMVRGNLLETMSEDYIRTARAKGLSERKVVFKHGLRASLTPVVTMFGLDFSTLLGGAVITETVFNLSGLGAYAVTAVLGGDLPVIMGLVVIASLAVTLMTLVVDILYAYLDPRVRLA
jgi:peptide/nickel transport system permease protein